MKYNKIIHEVTDLSDIFKKSDSIVAVDLESVQTGVKLN